jgi:hypothetical protein
MRNTGNEPAKRGGMGLGGYLALRDTPPAGVPASVRPTPLRGYLMVREVPHPYRNNFSCDV